MRCYDLSWAKVFLKIANLLEKKHLELFTCYKMNFLHGGTKGSVTAEYPKSQNAVFDIS